MRKIEITFLGRGGFGVVSSAKILASAAIKLGFYAQAMPMFNAERRGAGFSASLRISDKPIIQHYKISTADIVVCMSDSLFECGFLKNGGVLVVDSFELKPSAAYGVVGVDAQKIATDLEILSPEGRPFGNMAMLGALLKVLPEIDLATLRQIAEEELGFQNAAAVERGFKESVYILQDASLVLQEKAGKPKDRFFPLFPNSTGSTEKNSTGDWRINRPVFTESCSGPAGCRVCAVLCPENTIKITNGKMSIDYEYCKGCEICYQVCPLTKSKGIMLIPEKERGIRS